jgi:hypothetical protein
LQAEDILTNDPCETTEIADKSKISKTAKQMDLKQGSPRGMNRKWAKCTPDR